MIRALQLIFVPAAGWERIVLDQRRWVSILTGYLIPLLLLLAMIEGYGMVRWGKAQATTVVAKPLVESLGMIYWSKADGHRTYVKKFSLPETLTYEAMQFILSLGVVFLAASLIKTFGETFHGRHTFLQAFTVAAYGLGPLFLLRLLDASPSVPPWLTWVIGIALSLAVIYHGLPAVMRPDPAHAFGLYLMSALLLLFITGLTRFLTACYLAGKFVKLDALISRF
jgi:hypothetical protein